MNGIWVRSQSKRSLVLATNFHIMENDGKFDVSANMVRLSADADAATRVGIYPTEQRALEVLDEIQNFIRHGSGAFEDRGDFHVCTGAIFQMPES